jgi:hypothetical protein
VKLTATMSGPERVRAGFIEDPADGTGEQTQEPDYRADRNRGIVTNAPAAAVLLIGFPPA